MMLRFLSFRHASWGRRLALMMAAAMLLLLLALLGLAGRDVYWQAQMEEMQTRQVVTDLRFSIPSGAKLSEIARQTATAGVPLNIGEFSQLTRHLKIDSKLQAGVYRFAAGISVGEVLQAIAEGKVAPSERITIIEGQTYGDLRNNLRNDSRLRQITDTMSDDDLREALDIGGTSFEGMFLPETYFFNSGDSDLDILRRARRSMQKTLAELWIGRDSDLPLSAPEDALILASIVEKETGAAKERPLIASVFLNRLKRGMPLQADPTVIYGLGESFDGNLTRAHLRDKKNHYNTYKRQGLTPTPIALPGRAAIAAALQPAETDYYYFVASGNGEHVFSRTLRAHNNAVNKYQRRRQ